MKRCSPLLALGVALILAGCGGDSSNELPKGKTLVFYNSQNGAQMLFDTTTSKSFSLDNNESSPIYMKDKEQGRLLYWPGEAPGDDKIVMLKAPDAFDGNVTQDDFFYLAHFHGTELAAHAPSEINASTLERLSAYLANQAEIEEEIREAMGSQGEKLCNFYVPQHAHENNQTELHAPPHFAISKSAKLYVFEEGGSGLVPLSGQVPVALEGATTCNADESGITGYGEEGVLIFLAQTQTLYLVDSHNSASYHQHSKWKLSEFLPKDFNATQMVAFGEGEDHDHTD